MRFTKFQIVLAAVSFSIFPQNVSAKTEQEWLSTLGHICAYVYDRSKAQTGPYRFEYQRRVYATAGVTPDKFGNFTEDEKHKIQEMWNDISNNYPNLFQCNSMDFDVTNGSVLKYSVSSRSYGMLTLAIKSHINFNIVDKADQRTLLDYLLKELISAAGTDTYAELNYYFEKSREAGAKFACELNGYKMPMNADGIRAYPPIPANSELEAVRIRFAVCGAD